MSRSPRRPGPRPPDPFADPIATALVDAIVGLGYEATTVEAVLERSGATRAEFDARFNGKEDCVQKCFVAYGDDFSWKVRVAYDSEENWPDSLRAAAYAAARWLDDHPRTTRFGNLDVLFAENEMIRVSREELFEFQAALIEAGREYAEDPDAVPEAAALLVIGAIAQLLTQRLVSGAELDTPSMVPQMMYQAVRPYLGEERAREELTKPAPELPDYDALM